MYRINNIMASASASAFSLEAHFEACHLEGKSTLFLWNEQDQNDNTVEEHISSYETCSLGHTITDAFK